MQPAPLIKKVIIEAQNGSVHYAMLKDFSGTTACAFIVFIIKVIF